VLDLTLRLIASLAVVVGLLLLLARVAGKRFAGRPGAPLQVLHRQPLTRSASVAVVTVGTRVLVVGATDQQVNLLAELDPEELDTLDPAEDGTDHLVAELDTLATGTEPTPRPQPRPLPVRPVGAHRASPAPRPAGQAPLAGSVLSGDTWRQALAAVKGRAS
jgi:flagellar protein FliO/FliZ